MIAENKTSYPRYRGGNHKKQNVNSPYSEGADYKFIRKEKMKCQICQKSYFGTCSKNPISCQDFSSEGYDSRQEYAWDRSGAVTDGGFGR